MFQRANNIPYPSRRNDQKSRDKASNQMEKIFQIFQDLRFDISFADALLLMPRFAPTIKSLLMNKEKLLELAKIPLNENCSAMLLKKLPEKLGDPGKFLIPCNFPGMDEFLVSLILGRSFLRTGRALIDVYEGELILRDGNEQIIFHVDGISKHPQKHVNESIKMVNDTCEDSFEETNNLSSGSTTPLSDFHPSLESFKTSKSLLERFTDEPALVCLPPPEDDDDEKEKQEVKNIAEPTAKRQTRITPCLKNFKVIHKESIFHSNKTPQISLVFAITSALPTIKPKDSLIMGDEHLSTFRVEEIVPIPRESENTFDNNKGYDESFLKEDVQEEIFQVYSNPLFEIDDNHNSSNIILLFNEMLQDDECFDPGGDNDKIDAFLAIEVSTNIKEGYYDSEGDVIYLESLLSHDTFSPKSDLLHHEFAGSVITILPRIVREYEDYISLMSLLCENSSSQSPKTFCTIIESLPTSTTLVEDSDSNREETGPNDSIPPGNESDFDSEEDIIDNLLNNDHMPEYERLTFD
ncbi:hypothetical protein Tco_1451291, partial [Tanacetum coccineum]